MEAAITLGGAAENIAQYLDPVLSKVRIL